MPVPGSYDELPFESMANHYFDDKYGFVAQFTHGNGKKFYLLSEESLVPGFAAIIMTHGNQLRLQCRVSVVPHLGNSDYTDVKFNVKWDYKGELVDVRNKPWKLVAKIALDEVPAKPWGLSQLVYKQFDREVRVQMFE